MAACREVDVFAYDAIADLEETIEVVYQRQMAFNAAKDALLDEAAGFPEYRYDRDRFEAAARYVNSHYGDDGGIASIAKQYAEKELDSPEQARNWSLLLDAADAAAENGDELRAAHEDIWAAFGYTGNRFHEQVQDMVPFEHMLWQWDNAPFIFFRGEDSYDGLQRESGPTLARYVDGADDHNLTRKQRDDLRRGQELDRILDPETDREPGWMWEEDYYRENWAKTSKWTTNTETAEPVDASGR